MKLRLATYNIRIGIQQGLLPVGEVLRDSGADIIALQEVGRNWIMGPTDDSTAILAENINYPYAYFIPAIEQEGGEYGTAVLSKIDLGDPKIISLFQDVDEPRKVALFKFELNEEKVNLLTTHLSWIEDREKQIRELCELISSCSGPVLLMGDLNEHAKVLRELGLFELVKDAETMGRYTFPAHAPRNRIDYICASEGNFNWLEVHPNKLASDHLMVYGEWES